MGCRKGKDRGRRRERRKSEPRMSRGRVYELELNGKGGMEDQGLEREGGNLNEMSERRRERRNKRREGRKKGERTGRTNEIEMEGGNMRVLRWR